MTALGADAQALVGRGHAVVGEPAVDWPAAHDEVARRGRRADAAVIAVGLPGEKTFPFMTQSWPSRMLAPLGAPLDDE